MDTYSIFKYNEFRHFVQQRFKFRLFIQIRILSQIESQMFRCRSTVKWMMLLDNIFSYYLKLDLFPALNEVRILIKSKVGECRTCIRYKIEGSVKISQDSVSPT